MHLLYAVEFDVTAEGDASPFAAIQMQIAEWLSGGSSASVSVGDIETSGAVALPRSKFPGELSPTAPPHGKFKAPPTLVPCAYRSFSPSRAEWS